jgi:hypothetical protein
MHTDPRKAAEAFIEKVVVPARRPIRSDAAARRARATLASEDLKLARGELTAGGLDPKRLDKLAAERAKAREKLTEESRRRAVDASVAAADRLRRLVPVILPAEPVETVIDQMTFIRTYADAGVVIESNTGPSDNWARYRVESSSDAYDGIGRLSFFTLWQNQRDTTTVVMARANLVVNAYLSCSAEWNGTASWFGFSSDARATVRTRTTVWGMDSSISSVVQEKVLGSASAHGGFFGDDGSESIEFNELLPASGVVILPQAYYLIELELLTEWHANSGSVVLDGESGSHRIDLPQIVLTEIPSTPPPPPISLSASVSYATSPATVTLTWTGATTATVDIYRNGAFFINTPNTGSRSSATNPGTYLFRVCEAGSAVCSNDVTVTVA